MLFRPNIGLFEIRKRKEISGCRHSIGKSAAGAAHSKTWRTEGAPISRASVVECGGAPCFLYASSNPKGIASFSPGLRGTSYPGISDTNLSNPARVESVAGRCVQPFQGWASFRAQTEGSSCLATLGCCDRIPLGFALCSECAFSRNAEQATTAHSKTWRTEGALISRASVVECGGAPRISHQRERKNPARRGIKRAILIGQHYAV
jgi:hypothetical protein